jgi:peptide methionine sulfoxide reductase msrA/msrB
MQPVSQKPGFPLRATTFAVAGMALVLAGIARQVYGTDHGTSPAPQRAEAISHKQYTRPSDEQIRRSLSPFEYEVTQRAGTEPPFRNAFWNNHKAGLYVDIATGEPVFSSTDKFDSGTGWPSFTQPVEPDRVMERRDTDHGMVRTEVVSRAGKSHLGHVFDDGPPPTNLRYCINSAALRFVPADKLEAAGYGEYRALFVPASREASRETAILAGGCFWGMEEILRKIPGVLETDVGYTGGKSAKPVYEEVHTGATGHAEAVRIVFDPKKLSYADLLEKWYFRMHDPTTLSRQGNDVGTQYRSTIFVTSAEQRKIAVAVKGRVARSGRWKTPVVTEIVDAGPFTRAEDTHQKYLKKNPGGYTCHYLRD